MTAPVSRRTVLLAGGAALTGGSLLGGGTAPAAADSAYGQRDIAVTGQGVLDGRADATHWWDWTGGPPPNEGPDKTLLIQMAAAGVPVEERVFGAGHNLRPNLLQFNRCENVLLD